MLSIIQELENRYGRDGNIEALSAILHDKRMQALLKVHQRLSVTRSPTAAHLPLLQDIIPFINRSCDNNSPELNQLSSLISSSPHFVALLLCYDQILRKDYGPSLPDFDASDMISSHDEETMKVVRLVKGNEPLGATIVKDESTGNIIFSRIFKGGPADRSGLIHVNDILVEVNKVPTKGKSPEEVIAHLANFQGPLIFRLIPGEPQLFEKSGDNESIFVRAKFDFSPEDDPLIPCVQAGIHFRKNDILHIVSREDEFWWQASFVDLGVHAGGSLNSMDDYHSINKSPYEALRSVGLIPSSYLLKKRKQTKKFRMEFPSGSLERSFREGSSSSLSRKKGPWTLLRRTLRSPRHRLETSLSQLSPEFQVCDDTQEDLPFITYEEVVLYHHNSEVHPHFRPLVLIGPQGVGRNLLKERLINSNPAKYGVPVPHTSRPRLTDEEDGKDYHFVSRDSMEQGIRDNLFIEYGEYKGNLYGTSIAAVRSVMEDLQICVLTPYPQALKMLCNKDVKPFVIFIKPSPSMIDPTQDGGQSLLSDDMDELILRSEKLEFEYGHMFDYTIIFNKADSALDELLEVTYMVANQPQWIPKAWTQ